MSHFPSHIHFNNISLEKSDSRNFTLDPDDNNGLLPPFTSIDGLGASVGDSVIEARRQNSFLSKEMFPDSFRIELLLEFSGYSLHLCHTGLILLIRSLSYLPCTSFCLFFLMYDELFRSMNPPH